MGAAEPLCPAPLCLLLVGSSNHYNHANKSIPEHETKVGEHIGMILAYRRGGKTLRCIVGSGRAITSQKPGQPSLSQKQ
jgi:hypothetical protein